MSQSIKVGNASFDARQCAYDLAMRYAQEKLHRAFQNKKFESSTAPEDIEAMEYFATEFHEAFNYFSNVKIPDWE